MKLTENLFIIIIKRNSFILECNIEYSGAIATSYVSIQVMNGNADWSVTVQNKIAAFKWDVLKSCPSPMVF